MKELIKEVLHTYISSALLMEETFYVDTLFIKDNKKLVISKNSHSMDGIGTEGPSRVDPYFIQDSITEIKKFFYDGIVKTVSLGKESINVIDYPSGFDYHVWVKFNPKTDTAYLTINTSIHHKLHLKRNVKNSTLIIIYRDGSLNLKESKNFDKNKIIRLLI